MLIASTTKATATASTALPTNASLLLLRSLATVASRRHHPAPPRSFSSASSFPPVLRSRSSLAGLESHRSSSSFSFIVPCPTGGTRSGAESSSRRRRPVRSFIERTESRRGLRSSSSSSSSSSSFFFSSSSSSGSSSSPFGYLSSPDREVTLTPAPSEVSDEVEVDDDGDGDGDGDDRTRRDEEDEDEDEDVTHRDDRIAILTLNRPRAANALGRTMLHQLEECLQYLHRDDDDSLSSRNVRCAVITSSSPKVFCAGADLRERATMSREEAEEFVGRLRGAFDSVGAMPMPTIAAVEGAALGGGLELALAADVIVASDTATFGAPETSLAIIPGAGGTVRLPRRIGISAAKELIFTGRKIDAKEARELGLVLRCRDRSRHGRGRGRDGSASDGGGEEGGMTTTTALDEALRTARRIARNGPLALRAAKEAVDGGMEARTMSEAMEIEGRCYGRVIPTQDRLEGLRAFREGREPVYRGE